MPSATRRGRRSDRTISSAEIPMTARCRSITMSGPRLDPDRSYVIDTGFTAEIAAKRKRDYLRCPIKSLKLVGLDPAKVADVILTHLHYDHLACRQAAGSESTCRKAVAAQLHAYIRYQELRQLLHDARRHGPRQLCRPRRFLRWRRPSFAGIAIHPAPGRSAACDTSRAHQARMDRIWLPCHAFLREYGSQKPYVTAFRIGGMLEGFDSSRRRPSPQRIVAGHDSST